MNSTNIKANNVAVLKAFRVALFDHSAALANANQDEADEALRAMQTVQRGYIPTQAQWRRAYAIALGFGHLWACVLKGAALAPWEAGSPVTVGEVEDAVEALSTDLGSTPHVDDAGNITHQTATGRTQWTVSPEGRVAIRVGRPSGTALRVYLWRELAVEVIPELARMRHWQAAIQVTDALGEGFTEKLLAKAPPLVQRTMERIYEARAGLNDVDQTLRQAVEIHGIKSDEYKEYWAASQAASKIYYEEIALAEAKADSELEKIMTPLTKTPAQRAAEGSRW